MQTKYCTYNLLFIHNINNNNNSENRRELVFIIFFSLKKKKQLYEELKELEVLEEFYVVCVIYEFIYIHIPK